MSALAAAILDLQLKTTSGDVACSTVESGTASDDDDDNDDMNILSLMSVKV